MTEPKKRPAFDNAEEEPRAEASLAQVSGELLLSLSEDAIWMLQKKLLRRYFITLQTHFRALTASVTLGPNSELNLSSRPPLPHRTPPSQTQPQPTAATINPSRLLSLPPELRRQILLHLLSRPSSTPSRGPHPRSLQSPLSVTRTVAPSILRSCRLLYEEGCAVLYSTQEIHAHIDFDVWAHRRDRSDLVVSSVVRQAVRHLHVHIFLGNEKRLARPSGREAEARLEVVRKGVRKLGKWLVGPDLSMMKTEREGGGEGKEVGGMGQGEGGKRGGLQTLRISWQEPPQTYTWEQKKTVLDEFKAMRPRTVEAGEINWGLKYPGRKFRFVEEYLGTLGQVRGAGERVGPSLGDARETYHRMEMDAGM